MHAPLLMRGVKRFSEKIMRKQFAIRSGRAKAVISRHLACRENTPERKIIRR
jgi:hypothetical protein